MTADPNPTAPPPPTFPGFEDFRANVTYVPTQFFTVVLPNSSRGCARLVGFMIRKILGWVDSNGNTTREQLQFTYRDLIREARVSRDALTDALREAINKRFIRCVRQPRADRRGQAAESGIYELCWDNEGNYTDSLEDFRGFYYPEAAEMTVQENGRPVRRIKASRKNIPNAFFDFLLPRERLSVVRTVGALLFYSIKWGPGGERRAPVSRSISDLSRLTRLSRQHVHEAVSEAMFRGYIECVEPGRFDSNAGAQNRPATYGIRWQSALSSQAARRPGSEPSTRQTVKVDSPSAAFVTVPIGKGQGAPESHRSEKVNGHQSEKVNGEAVRKGERHQSEKVNGNRSEKVNGINTKTSNTKIITAATVQGTNQYVVHPVAAAAAVAPSVEQLVKFGFDAETARALAERHPPEVVQRQIEWFPLRKADTNRLGLLRRAIQGDWPKPEPARPADLGGKADPLGEEFARYYYAGYHGNEGEPIVDPLPRDGAAAGNFVKRLLQLEPDKSRVTDWGRRFGRLVRGKHQNDPLAKPFLSPALTLYGEELVRSFHVERKQMREKQLADARAAHEKAFLAQYRDYLRRTENVFRNNLPAIYASFEEYRRQSREFLAGHRGEFAPELLARLENETVRLEAFAAHFKKHGEHPVLSFWEWDARQNPDGFGRAQNHQEAASP